MLMRECVRAAGKLASVGLGCGELACDWRVDAVLG